MADVHRPLVFSLPLARALRMPLDQSWPELGFVQRSGRAEEIGQGR